MQIRHNYTEEQVRRFYDLYLGGLSCTQIAKQQGCTAHTICYLFKKYNLQVENRQNKINIDLETLIKEYESGKSLAQIGKECGNSYTTLSRMLKRAGIQVINRQNELRFNENVFDIIDTDEKAYWLGFIWADGNIRSIRKGKKPVYGFEITLCEQDYEHLVKFNTFMEHKSLNLERKVIKQKDKEFVAYRWKISNKHLWEILNNYGCIPNKSLVLKFPDKNTFTDPKLIYSFIRGYFDGDGCISYTDPSHSRPLISVLGTEDFLNNLDEYFFKDNTHLNFNSKKNNTTKVYSKVGAKALAFMYMLYYKSNIYLERKYQKFLYFKDCRFKAKALKLLEGKIGEGWDMNKELINDIKNGTIM